MSIKAQYLRTHNYLRRHGPISSIKRIFQELKYRYLYNRDVLFCRDLHSKEKEVHTLQINLKIERFEDISDMPEILFKSIAEHMSERLLRSYVRERFAKGASLWCLRNEAEYIGYLWSIVGRSMKPHYYFPLSSFDVHLDDGYIFPRYRRHGMFNILNNCIFEYYKTKGFRRVYQEVAEWNTASIKSAEKNGFIKIGLVSMKSRRGKCKVTWWV